MLSLSNVSAQQAENYYEKDDYYTQSLSSEEAQAKWFGKGFATLGLAATFQPQEFKSLLYGHDLEGNALHARRLNSTQHRSATDYTFSAPKSVSIAALIQQDQRVIQAHDLAVEVALSVMEDRYTQTRISTDTGRREVKTSNLVASVFRHETSREQDPQLHSHCVVINATQLPDGSWRSMSNEAAISHQKLLGQIYQNELAFQLQQCGYQIEVRPNGQFELKGYGQKILDIYSNRTQAIKVRLDQWEQAQGVIATPAQRKAATLKTRKNKEKGVDREALFKQWETELKVNQLQLPDIPKHRSVLIEGESNAITAVNAGVNHCSERENLFRRSQVERFALEHCLGEQSFSHLQIAFNYNSELILVELEPERYTTLAAINRERNTIQMMQSGQGKIDEIASLNQIREFTQHLTLTNEQRNALELSLTTKDQIIAWQGIAGAGKTYALCCFSQFAISQGYEIRGFVPSASAANVLSEEARIQSDTVAKLLHSKNEVTRSRQNSEIWIIDEAGLLSAKDCHALLQRALDENARVLLVGDTRQLSSVEAGNPFRLLQQHGIAIAHLEESRRQKDERLKDAVNALSRGDVELGFHYLGQADAIREVKTSEDRIQAIVGDYLALPPIQRANTLIVANTNAERRSITQGIRAGLQAEGQLAPDTFNLTSLKSRNWTLAQAKYAKQYELGDVIVPTQDYRKQQLIKGQQYAVVAIDEMANRLTLETISGQRFELDPGSCDRKTVYKTEPIPIGSGERLRWTRNDRIQNRRNGQEFTIVQINDQGKAIVSDGDGKTTFIDLSGRQFADYGVVSTTYASQGKTADRVLAALDGTTGKESFYVVASRAKRELAIYTTNAVELQKLAARSRANENASDYLDLLTYEKRYAQNQTWTINSQRTVATATDDSTNRGISVRSHVGERLAATLQRNCRTEANASDLEQNFNAFGRTNWLARIDVNAVATAVAGFVERRAIRRNEGAIRAAFESIISDLQQLERISQTFAECDRILEREALTPVVSDFFLPQRSNANLTAPHSNDHNLGQKIKKRTITLAQTAALTQEDWLQLTPRQQLALVQAARSHQQDEPMVCTQVEQWIGQTVYLIKQFQELRDRALVEKAIMNELEERGQQSWFNPFGASSERLSEARKNYGSICSAWKRTQAGLDVLQVRQAKRQEEETSQMAWSNLPDTQGAQRVIELMRQPEVRSRYEQIVQTINYLQQWQQAAEQLGHGAIKLQQIRQVTQGYLDEREVPQAFRQEIQEDLTRCQYILKRQKQLEI